MAKATQVKFNILKQIVRVGIVFEPPEYQWCGYGGRMVKGLEPANHTSL